MKRALTIILMILFLSNSFAQERSFMLGVGRSSLLDTYLSPEHFTGLGVSFIDENTTVHKDSLLSHTWTTMGQASKVESRSEVSSELVGTLSLAYGMHYRALTSEKYSIAVGGEIGGFIGGIYNTRNGNNPAQLKAGADIASSVRADYRFRLWRRNFCLNYEARLPLVGMQFSPAYGQSYYEIFNRGSYDHNLCLTTPLNALSYSHLVALDFQLFKKTLRVGYLGDYRQAELNSLKYHIFTHSIMIGWRL